MFILAAVVVPLKQEIRMETEPAATELLHQSQDHQLLTLAAVVGTITDRHQPVAMAVVRMDKPEAELEMVRQQPQTPEEVAAVLNHKVIIREPVATVVLA
jgi:hypothetical protein